MGYLREDRYNPNFRHLLPAYQRDQLFFFLTASGAKAARLVREHRQEGADVEAYRREVLQLQQQLVVIQREAASALENTKNELADTNVSRKVSTFAIWRRESSTKSKIDAICS